MLDKTYDPSKYELDIQTSWDKQGVFKPKKSEKGSHINILPPPNANGELHLGHASGYTIMDIAGRFARMNGNSTLLLPGKDHAGILTQLVFERKLKNEDKIKKEDLSRDELYSRCYDFCMDSAEVMRSQEKRIGISADWDREKFTLDPTISKEVIDTFIKMYKQGIAYRGNRIINWCPCCKTALSDMEVEHKEQKTKLYWIKYGPFILATTRPETKLGDTAVAVSPDDERYKDMIGKKYSIKGTIGDFEVVVVGDESVDSEFGSGAVKVTPAHSFIDFEIAQRHGIKAKSIIDKDGKMMSNCGKYHKMTTLECRKEIVNDLEGMGLIEKIDENYVNKISVHDRCGNSIEPLISDQWWINVDHPSFSLKNEAISVVKSGKIKIVPKHFEKTFFHWMENLQDWCISRQLWWGHRIPAWYKDGEIKVQQSSPGEGWKQDEDTFDTWFSSGQWASNTVALFGDDKQYFPGDFMVMGRDILFFWACRMIMFSLYKTGEVPFSTLYLTGLIKDRNGKKMSKSKGNGIDPLKMADKYGTDALRLSLFIGNSPGNDMRLYEEKIKGYRNFVNKLWNASRFVQIQSSDSNIKNNVDNFDIQIDNLTHSDKWILTSLQRLIHEVTNDIKSYQYSNAGQKLYDFTWSEFCDWYLELSKGENQNLHVLNYTLNSLLKLLHPFIPFVTEVLYGEIFGKSKSLALMSWPVYEHDLIYKSSLKDVNSIISCIKTIRNMKIDMGIEVTKKISIKIKSNEAFLIDHKQDIIRLARLESLEIGEDIIISDDIDIISTVSSSIVIGITKDGNIDTDLSEEKKLKEISILSDKIENLNNRLSNESYLKKAPKSLVDQSKSELEEYKMKLGILRA